MLWLLSVVAAEREIFGAEYITLFGMTVLASLKTSCIPYFQLGWSYSRANLLLPSNRPIDDESVQRPVQSVAFHRCSGDVGQGGGLLPTAHAARSS